MVPVAEPIDQLWLRIAQRYPALHLMQRSGEEMNLIGSIVIDDDGVELDRFSVRIDLLPLAKGKLPSVYETAGRIPRTMDRHMTGTDGLACVCLELDYLLAHPGRFDLGDFIEGPVRSFFLGQALVERGESWPFGEWNHGHKGTADWWREFLRSQPRDRLFAFFKLLAGPQIKGHWRCPCGSGRRLRDCHLSFVRLLRQTPREVLDEVAEEFGRILGTRRGDVE